MLAALRQVLQSNAAGSTSACCCLLMMQADNILMSEAGEVRLADFGVAAARARQVGSWQPACMLQRCCLATMLLKELELCADFG
jgi:hypothetical protein